ncbi:hypothetical protein SAMN04489806_0449 [Paramicrobacterium humi]|uniref:Uncharacterized protein n=1 Tax=Paramicrobacterium humi TaxID=640635 RepID=A0A1H4J2D3_9MICO|nr:DUF6121 family protein [Microbacterium humi]SEB40460.1 hypothetical protein SAMN04489806_0449 [Microbacterium humi]
MEGSDGGDPRLVSLALAAFAVVLYLALLVASFGVISLVTDTDVIDTKNTGLLVGPAMSGSALVIVAVRLAGVAIRHVHDTEHGFTTARIPLGAGVVTGICATLAYVAIGAMLRALEQSQLVELVLFGGHQLLRPYAWTAGILALVVHVLFAVVLATRGNKPGRPLWPWEK